MDLGALPTLAEVAGLSGADLDRALVDLEVARRQLEAAYVAVLDHADADGRFRSDGHASVRGWAMALTNASPAETKRRLQTMRALRNLPETSRHLADGTIGVDQVREIAKLHANPRIRELVVAGDSRLVEHSRQDFVSFSEVLHRWEQFGDPSGAEQRHVAAHEGRDAVMFERDGVVHVHAKCGTGQGAALMDIFQRQCDAEFLADWEAAQAHAATDGGDPVHRWCLRSGIARRATMSVARLRSGVVTQPDRPHPRARPWVCLTTPENGGPACGRHNRIKTHGYTAYRESAGTWHVHRPDGTELTEPAAA